MTDVWEQMVSSALMGTERRAFSPPADYGVQQPDPDAALLDMAAILTLQRRAGWQPPTYHGALPVECEPDQLPRCSPRAVNRLAMIMNDTHRDLLPEWLEAAGQNGWRVPEEFLPALLAQGRREVAWRASIIQAIGRRGRWLAGQNPEWAYAAGGDDVDWEEASHAARFVYLFNLRKADPAHGRVLLEGSWENEPARYRAELLACLEIGLSMEDEPFLEAALDDRSQWVRDKAADLLAHLPDSRLVARVQERVGSCVRFDGQEFELDLPAELDEAMQRDGVTDKLPSSLWSLGKRAWWLTGMIQAVPPVFWSERFKADPADLVQAAGECEWKDVLHEGWIAALQRHPDLGWAVALLAEYPTRTDMLTGLPPKQREQCVMAVFQTGSVAAGLPLLQLIAACQHPWSVPFAEFVLGQLSHCAQSDERSNHKAARLIKTFGHYIPPHMVGEVRARLLAPEESKESDWRKTVKTMVSVLEFRRRMWKELER
jgi:hypothetical protein